MKKRSFRGFPKDPKTMSKFELIGHNAMLAAKGNYKASGKVLLFPLSGDGYAELKFCKHNPWYLVPFCDTLKCLLACFFISS